MGPQPKAAPAPKPKPKPTKQASAPVQEPLLDKQAEKLRLRKLEEEANARLADDLFSGCDKPQGILQKEKEEKENKEREEAARKAAKPKVIIKDAFDNVNLDVQADVERLCEVCVNKLDRGK